MYRVFNMGIGMVAAVAPDHMGDVKAMIPEATVIGVVVARGDGAAVRIIGLHSADHRG